jgi:N-hydroxyarylamine O-acetyltransferase
MDIDAYCARIAYGGPRVPTLDVLRALTERHPRAIAFENATAAAGGVPDVSPDAVHRKLVGTRRGGYCFEQNTLLQSALVAFGFTVAPLSARVRYGIPDGVAMPRSHMILLVELPQGRFLADAGFGNLTLTAPVALRAGGTQATPHEDVRLLAVHAIGVQGPEWRLQARIGEAWRDLYQFDLTPHLSADFVMQNWFSATRPHALFAHNLVAARPGEGGRHVLFNRTLTWRPLAGGSRHHEIADARELEETLRGVFGLEIAPDELAGATRTAFSGRPFNPGFG